MMNEEDIIIEEDEGGLQDKIKKLQEKLKGCNKEKEEYLAGWQRAKADFINARKEEEETRKEFLEHCEASLIYELLEVADSFDVVLKNLEKADNLDKNWKTGIKNIHSQFIKVLMGKGVGMIDCLGKKFDPKLHESIGEEKVDTEEKEGIIINEIQKGYKLHNKIIRSAKVKIGKYIK